METYKNKKIQLDIDSIVINKILKKGIEIVAIFEIHTLNDQTVYNDGKVPGLNNNSEIIANERKESEKNTSILSGYFINNLSSKKGFSYRINLFDDIHKKDKDALYEYLKAESKKFQESLENSEMGIDSEKLKTVIENAILTISELVKINNPRNEADLKYLFHNIIKQLLIKEKIENVLVLVEYKIYQGNDSLAWFSSHKFLKDKEFFVRGYETKEYPGFVKVTPLNHHIIDAKSKNIFSKQKDRNFKVDIALLNSLTGIAQYLIELKYSPNIKYDLLESDIVKFLIYNSINKTETTGLAIGFNSTLKNFIIKSNDEKLSTKLKDLLNNKSKVRDLPIKQETKGKDLNLSIDKILEIAEQTLFDKDAYGNYAFNFIESSWQAEFNYRIKDFLSNEYKIINEYPLTDSKERLDILILRNDSPIYLIEFKQHAERIPKELLNKVFKNKKEMDFITSEIRKELKKINYNQIEEKSYQYAPKDITGEYIFNPKLLEKIETIFSQYYRMIDFIRQYPKAVGFMFFNDWGLKINDYELKKLGITQSDFDQCYLKRKAMLESILDVNEHKDKAIFKYFNLRTE